MSVFALALLAFVAGVDAGEDVPPRLLPDAPSYTMRAAAAPGGVSSSSVQPYSLWPADQKSSAGAPAQDGARPATAKDSQKVDADGNPIALNRQQPKRILGFLPNFRTVAAGAVPERPSFKHNFRIATQQSFDYSSFIFLGITSLTAEGLNQHPVLGKGIEGAYEYTWRGFLDKTDNTYLSAWLLASTLHEDTRFYPLGTGHRVPVRIAYVISRQAVARTYSGHQTFNLAGLGAKALTQYISRYYYPTGADNFSVLATKFAYSAMRDIGISSIREFYPDIAAHYIRKHREKMARLQAAQP